MWNVANLKNFKKMEDSDKSNILDIVVYPSDILRQKSLEVEKIGNVEKKLFNDMLDTMYFYKGVGLAAVQVGILKKMLVVDVGNNKKIKLANPNIIAKKGIVNTEEGCLSVPNKNVKVNRAEQIVVKALDENNKYGTFLFTDMEAIAVQHEIDHLDGKIILDYLDNK